jgi:hypothetical protein
VAPIKAFNTQVECLTLLKCSNANEKSVVKIGPRTLEEQESQDKSIITVVNKQKFHVKERKINIANVKKILTADHPGIVKL